MNSQDKFQSIQGHKICYRVHGHGSDIILMIHGAVGSTNDFVLQVQGEEQLDQDKFTIVLVDLPGYGKSRFSDPDERIEPRMIYYQKCADLLAKLMMKLNYKTYSIAGWSDGARVGCLLAIKYQSRINSLLIWSFIPINESNSTWALAKTRDISTWSYAALKFYTDVYGTKEFSDNWRRYVDYLVAKLEFPTQFDIRSQLSQIKCPTLILHGSSDPIVDFKQHVEPLESIIYNSSINQLPGLAHNLHQANASQFKSLLTNFVTGIGVC